MTPRPPRDERELIGRAEALAGRALGELAAALGVALEGPAARTKGLAGQVVERALGATAGSAPVPDFEALGIELKTIPVDARGAPRESTFVCGISLATIADEQWPSSRCRRKLARVLWLPLEGAGPGAPPLPERRLLAPRLWSPSPAEDEALRADWEELVGLIGVGGIEELDARAGRWLQVRPKAANARARTIGYGDGGEPLDTLPRGFYLRARFTARLLTPP